MNAPISKGDNGLNPFKIYVKPLENQCHWRGLVLKPESDNAGYLVAMSWDCKFDSVYPVSDAPFRSDPGQIHCEEAEGMEQH